MRTIEEINDALSFIALAGLAAEKLGKINESGGARAIYEALEWATGKDNEFGSVIAATSDKVKGRLEELAGKLADSIVESLKKPEPALEVTLPFYAKQAEC